VVLFSRRTHADRTFIPILHPSTPSLKVLQFKVYEELYVRGKEDETWALCIIEFAVASRTECYSILDIGKGFEREETGLSVQQELGTQKSVLLFWSNMHGAHIPRKIFVHTPRSFCPMTWQLSSRVLALQSQHSLPYNDKSWFRIVSVKRIDAVPLTSRLRLRPDDCDDGL